MKLLSQLEQFSACGRTPTYVFGGSLPHREVVSECLALSGDIWAPELNGADEVSWMVGASQKNHSCYTEGPRKLALPILMKALQPAQARLQLAVFVKMIIRCILSKHVAN